MNKSSHPLYTTWTHIIGRCTKPNDDSYKSYGGRGISVCARWSEDFWSFVEDMGEKPTPKHTVDRIDNDGNYEPGNCRWATRKEQAQNTRIFISATCTKDDCARAHKSRGLCQKHYTEWYRKENPEWYAAAQKRQKGKYPEKHREGARAHYWKNVELSRARQKELREQDPEKYREYYKKYYQKNITKLREKARERARKRYKDGQR